MSDLQENLISKFGLRTKIHHKMRIVVKPLHRNQDVNILAYLWLTNLRVLGLALNFQHNFICFQGLQSRTERPMLDLRMMN